MHKNRDMASSIEKKKQEAEDNWEKLEDLSDSRLVVQRIIFQ